MSDAVLISSEETAEVPAAEIVAEVHELPIAEVEIPAENPAEAAVTVADRTAILTAVQAARDLPPGVRERLTSLVEQTPALDASGEPLLPTRLVLELLAQGLPPLLRRETTTAVNRLEHPTGDAFFQVQSDELSDQQAEQIAKTQLQRAGWLRT